ncbi:hypothetical protein HPP92_005055 [Vanilla planifolia]|uniref:Uncharacterized protein n=1 Tax=Vanilla planifolia TaxID=51239 RepID=A0A835RKZ6_VANPL|nr:hypothetical protein HPP92_005408 [Vanilla planifolia]KAG0494061.1 hypothetical protein HPP92_005055 [Vanilla planifolia]
MNGAIPADLVGLANLVHAVGECTQAVRKMATALDPCWRYGGRISQERNRGPFWSTCISCTLTIPVFLLIAISVILNPSLNVPL